ncbi:hypothetical protein [Glaciimonas sp. PAMC28666]|uniref:hypothetical protein n=1 Tax=Glaciimonas sp. PAMC28666 TaxID=2807626 RepID=UPI0019638403|nr:hypothetical protein [Glaciimonas sp. PAMC28666]QRX82132.1 hypothetical protein JQN73_18805 [Glaciimonas sp. PAMC28666]
MQFPVIDRKIGVPNSPVQDDSNHPGHSVQGDGAQPIGSAYSTLADIGERILTAGQEMYANFPAWPGLLPGVAADSEIDSDPFWAPGYQEKKRDPVPRIFSSTTAAPTVPAFSPITYSADSFLDKTAAWHSINKETILNGISAYQRWPARIPQDVRLKGMKLERPLDPSSSIDQLLDTFAPIMPRKMGDAASVDQYEYAVLKYAIHHQLRPSEGDFFSSDPSRPQAALQQAVMQSDVSHIFFNSLGQVFPLVDAQSLEKLVRTSSATFLSTNPPLNTFAKFADGIKMDVDRRLNIPGHAFTKAERARLSTLVSWFVASELGACDPLFNSRIEKGYLDFDQTLYQSDDATLMSIGAGFIARYPGKPSTTLTPALLREGGMHCLIYLSSKEWPPNTYASLTQLGTNLLQHSKGIPSEAAPDNATSALAHLIAPVMQKIRLMKVVSLREEEFVNRVNERDPNAALHQALSRDALSAVTRSKFDLYRFGLAQLPISDQENLIRSSNRNLIKVYTPKVTLYEAVHYGVAYQASFNGTSGLILKSGSEDSEGGIDYYLFSEERCWGSPVVSKITENIHRAGGINKYVKENHAAFTHGLGFPSADQTAFETNSFSIYATTLDEIALSVSGLQSNYPAQIHEGIFDVRQPQQPSPNLAEKIFHSKIFAIGKFVIGVLPTGSCVIAVLDIAEMIALPAKTDAELADQGLTLAADALFCFSGMVKLGETRNIIRSVRAAFNFNSPEEFAAGKAAKPPPEKSSEIEQEFGSLDGAPKLASGESLSTATRGLGFRSGLSDFVDTPLTTSGVPDIIFIRKNRLEVPSNLQPEGLIQKSAGGPLFLVLNVGDSEKRVSYLWNESERQLERQTDQWLNAYGHLMDRDPKALALFRQDLLRRAYSKHISDMLYNNNCINAIQQHEYQSHFDHPPVSLADGVYSVGDRRYIEINKQFYMLAHKPESAAVERVVGQEIPKDLQLDMRYDGGKWNVVSNHLISPVSQLPKVITTFADALKQGFNLPEGWQATAMYVDSENIDQFIFSFRDSDGNTLYRRGPDRKNVFEMLSHEEFEEIRCNRARRSPPDGARAGCRTMSPHIVPLSSEFERAIAIKQLVALDVETRPYYERPLLRLEVVRNVEKINDLLEGNPGRKEQIVDLIARTKRKPVLELQRALQGMGYLMQGRVPLLNEALLNLTDFWEKIQAQLTKESFGSTVVRDPELQKLCKIGLQLCDKLRSYNILGETYTAKVKTLNRLSHDYESEFITPKQKASARLWKTVFGPVLTSGFQKVRGWTFETRAKGLSEISELYGAEVAYDIQSTYTDSHQLAGDMVEWSKNDPASFWKQASSFFHVSDAPSPIVMDLLAPILSTFKECAHPEKTDALCVISPAVSPDGIQYRYNPEEHAEGIPQEGSLFGNLISAFTYEQGKKRGRLFLSTATFLSPTTNLAELQETLQHELSHLAIPKSADEFYLNSDRSRYGHYSAGALGRQADVILDSANAFLKYVEDSPKQTIGFLRHCDTHLPALLKIHFPEGIEGHAIDKLRFRHFVIAIFKGPAEIKIKAFMMPDIFVAWLQHMAKGLPKIDAENVAGSGGRQKRESYLNAMEAPVGKLLVRELFEVIRHEQVIANGSKKGTNAF